MIAPAALGGALVFSLMYGSIAATGIFKAMNFGKPTLFKISENFLPFLI